MVFVEAKVIPPTIPCKDMQSSMYSCVCKAAVIIPPVSSGELMYWICAVRMEPSPKAVCTREIVLLWEMHDNTPGKCGQLSSSQKLTNDEFAE